MAEIKASPAKPGQQFLGRLGQVAEKLGIKLEEAMKIVAQEGNSPVKAFLVNMLGSEWLKSAGTALQDWTGTPRDATEDYPYRRLVTGKGMTAQFDPRLVDVAPIAGTAASRVAGAMKNLPTDVMRAATAAYGPQATASHIFIGAKSPLWKASQAEKAVELEKAGVNPVDIWKQTGTFRSPDGALRQEISDVGSKFRGEKEMKELAASMKQQEDDIRAKIAESKLHPDLFPKQLTAAQKQARQQTKDIKARRTMEGGPEYRVSRGNRAEFALEHPELYEAYPLLSGMDVQQGGRYGSSRASYTRGINENDPGLVNIYDLGLQNDPRSSAIHEVQHAIQNIEGWGRGGNPTTAFQNPEAFDILNQMRKQALEPLTYEEYVKRSGLDSLSPDEAMSRYEAYKKRIPDAAKKMDVELQRQAAKLYYDRLAGEAEARAAQARIDLTPRQRLENFPLETGTQYGYDVKPEDIIVKRNKKGGQVSIDAMRLAVQNKAKGGAATSNEAMLRRAKRLGKVDKPVSIPPLQLARGWAAGTAGLLGDIESLGRAIIPGIDEKTFYQQYGRGAPTSEEMLKIIPGEAEDEVGKRAAEVGTLFGGAGIALGGKLAAKGARAIAPKIGETAEEYMFRAGMALPAVPPSKGSAKNIAMEKFFPGKTYDELSSAEKSAITRFESEMKNPAVRRREAFSGPTIIEPTVQMKEVKKVSPEEILKNPLMPLTGDVSGGGYKIKQVSGIPLEESVDVQGGYPYAFIHEMLGSPLGWASMSTAAKKKMIQAYDIAQKTGISPLAVFTAMKNPESINFSTPVVEAMLRQLHAIDPSKGAIRDINKAIREKFGTYRERPDFVGIDDSDIIAQLRGESGFAKEGAGDLRKKIVEIMSQAKYRKMGFPKYDDVADAIVAESLRGSDRGLSGSAIFKTDPNAPLISDPNIVQHLSYDTGIPRDITYPVSQLKDPIPASILYRDIFNQGMTEGFPLSEVDIKKKKVRRPLTSDEILGALMMRNDLVQLPSQEHMDYVMNYMRKNFPESNYKKGGAVKKAEGGAATINEAMLRRERRLGKVNKPVSIPPKQLARGWAAGTLGLPGDIESLGRAVIPGVSEETFLPTSEDVLKKIPGAATDEAGQRAAQVGTLFGGAGAGRIANAMKYLPIDVMRAAVEAYGPQATAAHVIKPKGGNWLVGNVEEALKPLKTGSPDQVTPINDPNAPGGVRYEKLPEDPLNQWIDKQLTRYVKNEMGTPEDPIRNLAEKGTLHFTSYRVDPTARVDEKRRQFANKNKGKWGYGQSQMAQNWEDAADKMINVIPAEVYQNFGSSNMTGKPGWEWINKVDPDTPFYGLNRGVSGARGNDPSIESIGFDHLIDELTNALDPNSGLPRNLQLKPESLSRLSVPQAVERVAKINEWRAAQKAEADIARANNPATVTVKEYPEGFRWAELKTPGMPTGLPEGWSEPVMKGNALQTRSPSGDIVLGENLTDLIKNIYKRHPETPGNPRQALQDALKYEGEQMGHCVGGYCPDVESGQSKIYSLRDAKGQPHVTIEVAPSRDIVGKDEAKKYLKAAEEEAKKSPSGYYDDDVMRIAMRMAKENLPLKIVQIKGKGNAKPADKYLPFVQDFVRSGNWSDVGDLQNTGLIRRSNVFTPTEKQGLISLGQDVPEYLTQEDIARLNKIRGELPNDNGMKRGGPVSMDAMRLAVMDKNLRKQHG